jgi:hypothetical protein
VSFLCLFPWHVPSRVINLLFLTSPCLFSWSLGAGDLKWYVESQDFGPWVQNSGFTPTIFIGRRPSAWKQISHWWLSGRHNWTWTKLHPEYKILKHNQNLYLSCSKHVLLQEVFLVALCHCWQLSLGTDATENRLRSQPPYWRLSVWLSSQILQRGQGTQRCPMSCSLRGQRTHWILQWGEEKMAESTEVRCTVTKMVTRDMMDVGQTFLIENLPYHTSPLLE